MSNNYSQKITSTLGLVGYWRLGEPNGTTAADLSGYNNTGTYSGTYTLGQESALFGDTNSSVSLNVGRVVIADSVSLRTPVSGWSMEAWIKPSNLSGTQNWLRKDGGPSGFFIRQGGSSFQSLWAFGGGVFSQPTGGTIQAGVWQHAVATYDGANIRHYIDGVQVYSTPETRTFLPNNATTVLGSQGSGGGEDYIGLLDECAVYNVALSPAQVLEHYREGGPVAKDQGPGNHPGVYVGSPSVGATGAIRTATDTAVEFNGIDQYISVTPDVAVAGPFSVEGWFKADSWTGAPIINRRDVADTGGYELSVNTGGQVGFFIHNGTSWTGGYAARVLRLGHWYHVVATYDGSTGYIVINGQVEATLSSMGTLKTTGTMYTQIGRNVYLGYAWDGVLDEIALYNAAMDYATIQLHYAYGVHSDNIYEHTIEGTPGLVAYWPVNEPGGASSYDESGRGHTLNVGSGITRSSDGVPLAGAYAANYDNTGNSWMRRTVIDADLNFGAGDFSIEFWCKQDVVTGGPLVEYGDTTSYALHIWQFPDPSQIYISYGGGFILQSNTGVIVADTWHHIVVLRNGNAGTLYIDGVQSITNASLFSGATLPFGYPLQLGFRQVSGGEASHYGLLDQVAFYNVALTPAQIADHHTKGLAPPLDPYATVITGTSGLIAYYRLNEDGISPDVIDSSGNIARHDGDWLGNETYQEPGPLLSAPSDTSVKFLGTGGVNVVNHDDFDLTGNMTLECWYKPASANSGLISKGFSPTSDRNYWWEFNTGGIGFGQYTSSGYASVNSTNPVTAAVWNHLVVVRSGTTIIHYKNGIANGSGPLVGTPIISTAAFIIGYNNSVAFGGEGWFDEVAVYNVALSSAQVLEHYQAAFVKKNVSGAAAGTATVAATASKRQRVIDLATAPVETFDTGAIDTGMWTLTGSGATQDAVGGTLNLGTTPGIAGTTVGVTSLNTYNLLNKTIMTEIVQRANLATSNRAGLRVTTSAGSLGVFVGQDAANLVIGTLTSTVIFITWPAGLRFVRIIFEAPHTTGATTPRIYCDYSTDGTTWLPIGQGYYNQGQISNAALATARPGFVQHVISGQTVADPGTAKFDNLNTIPIPYKNLTGTSNGISTATATPVRRRALIGSSAGVTTEIGQPSKKTRIAAAVSAAGVATVSVQIARKRAIAGTSAGVAVEVGQPTVKRRILATAVGGSTASGVIGKAAQFKDLVGSAVGIATCGQPSTLITDRLFPTNPAPIDGFFAGAYELTMRFKPTATGKVTGLMVNCGAPNTTQTMSLHHYEGGAWVLKARKAQLLAVTGWQAVNFDAPVDCYDDGQPWIASRFSDDAATNWARSYGTALNVITSPNGLLKTDPNGAEGWGGYAGGLVVPLFLYYLTDDFAVDVLFESGVSGLPTVINAKRALAGASPGKAIATGPTILRKRALVAASAGASTVAVQLVRKRALTAAASGAAIVSVQLRTKKAISGTAQGRATNTATIVKTSYKNLVASAAGIASVGQGNAITDRFFPGLPTPTQAPEAGTLYELGMMFTPKVGVNGNVMGVSFYRTLGDTQNFTVSLYDYDSGWTLVARKTASSSTTGWQTINFDEPKPIVYDGFAYMVTYWSPTGQFARTPNVFLSPGLDTTNLHAYYDTEAGAQNGAFEINAGGPDTSYFPASFEASNYHVDVLFSIGVAGGIIEINVKRALTGAAIGTSTTIAQPVRRRPLVAASAGVATEVGQPTARRRLVAASAGISTASGSVTRQTGPKDVVGSAAGGSTASAQIRTKKLLTVTSAGQATVTAILTTEQIIVGAASGAATVAAQISVKQILTGTSAGISATTAVATRRRPIIASSAGSASVSVVIQRKKSVIASIAAGVATVSVTISKGTAYKAISGSATGLSTVAVTTTAKRLVTGASAGSATEIGQPTRKRALTAASVGTATVTAFLTRRRALVATSAGVAVAATAIPIATRRLAGTSVGSSTGLGTIQKLGAIVFAAQRFTGTAQKLTVDIKAGAVFGCATMSGTAQELTAGVAGGTVYQAALLTVTTQKSVATVNVGVKLQAALLSATTQAQIVEIRTGLVFPAVLATATAQESVVAFVAGIRFNAILATGSLSSYNANMLQGLGFAAQLMQSTASAYTSNLRSSVVWPTQVIQVSTQSQSAVMRTSSVMLANVVVFNATAYSPNMIGGARITALLMTVSTQTYPLSAIAAGLFLAQRMQASADFQTAAVALGNKLPAQLMLVNGQSFELAYITSAAWAAGLYVVNADQLVARMRQSLGIFSPGPDIIYAEHVVPIIVNAEPLVPYIVGSAEPQPVIVNGELLLPHLYAKDQLVPIIESSDEV